MKTPGLRIFIISAIFLFISHSSSQSPFYSIKLKIAPTTDTDYIYTISTRVCELNYIQTVPSGDYWFGKDTSVLNWNSLPDSMYKLMKCSDVRTINASAYEESNQAMVWENIYKFTITRKLPGGNADTMTIVFPVLQKSFVTFIKLEDLSFEPGYFEPGFDLEYKYSNYLYVTLPAGYKWTPIERETRKIKL
jgi:hypothetical protein